MALVHTERQVDLVRTGAWIISRPSVIGRGKNTVQVQLVLFAQIQITANLGKLLGQ